MYYLLGYRLREYFTRTRRSSESEPETWNQRVRTNQQDEHFAKGQIFDKMDEYAKSEVNFFICLNLVGLVGLVGPDGLQPFVPRGINGLRGPA